jgi:hypothetical protein
MRPAVALHLVATLALLAGCAHVVGLDALAARRASGGLLSWSADRDLPARTQLEVGQLVIHADFPVAGQHRLVRELDALRTDVSQRLGLPVSDEPVHLYLFEDAGRYEAFAARQFPGFPVRRAFFVETDTSLVVFAAWQDRVAEDLRHETTHGYVHAVAPAVPLWLDEGIAELFEVPRHEDGVHRGHVALLAGRIIEGTWRPDMERLEQLASAGELSQDHYAESWCWVHWLLHTTPARRRLLQEYLADVRRDGRTAPLSLRLRHAPDTPPDLAAAIRGHVESLAAATGQQ